MLRDFLYPLQFKQLSYRRKTLAIEISNYAVPLPDKQLRGSEEVEYLPCFSRDEPFGRDPCAL